jgi:hypothetical protein
MELSYICLNRCTVEVNVQACLETVPGTVFALGPRCHLPHRSRTPYPLYFFVSKIWHFKRFTNKYTIINCYTAPFVELQLIIDLRQPPIKRCFFVIQDKCHNLSKGNVKLILKILSDLKPLRGSSNKKRCRYSTRSFHSRFKLAHSCHKEPNLHTKLVKSLKNIFCLTLSEFENFPLCERILINLTTCQNETSS